MEISLRNRFSENLPSIRSALARVMPDDLLLNETFELADRIIQSVRDILQQWSGNTPVADLAELVLEEQYGLLSSECRKAVVKLIGKCIPAIPPQITSSAIDALNAEPARTRTTRIIVEFETAKEFRTEQDLNQYARIGLLLFMAHKLAPDRRIIVPLLREADSRRYGRPNDPIIDIVSRITDRELLSLFRECRNSGQDERGDVLESYLRAQGYGQQVLEMT
jgi:hypothetical protein